MATERTNHSRINPSQSLGDFSASLGAYRAREMLNTSLSQSRVLPDLIPDDVATNLSRDLTPAERITFHQKIAMIGYGVYGKALHSRLSDFDILPWERKSSAHPSSEAVTNSLSKAVEGRGMIILAVPSNAFPSVLEKIRPHEETVVVSLAKGLIVPNWNPFESERSLREGPPEGAQALTPLEYIRSHPNWAHVANNAVFVGGPGFARDVQDGAFVGLTLGGKMHGNPRATDAVAKAFFLFSGMSGDKGIEVYDNPTALEIAASMKNVAAFAAGIILGVLQKHGALEVDKEGRYRVTKRLPLNHGDHRVVLDSNSVHRLVNFANREIVNVVKSEGGENCTQLTMAGGQDLNLTVNSLTSRNVQAGMRLAQGENIYEMLTKRDAEGHRLTAEGVFAAHAMARRIQNNNEPKAFAPLVFAVRNILMNRGTPEDIIAQYFGQTKQWTEGEAHRVINGSSRPMGLRVHVHRDSINAI